jgi:hypothetical protein
MIDFVNLKIKLTQYFRSIHKSRICVRVFIKMSAHIYIYEDLHLYYISKKIT